MKAWDPKLHPKGPDGRFVKKNAGWATALSNAIQATRAPAAPRPLRKTPRAGDLVAWDDHQGTVYGRVSKEGRYTHADWESGRRERLTPRAASTVRVVHDAAEQVQAKARLRQAEINHKRGVSGVVGDLRETLHHQGSQYNPKVLRARLAAAAGRQPPPPGVQSLLEDTINDQPNSRRRLTKNLDLLEMTHGLARIGSPGEAVPYDPRVHQPTAGQIRPGQQVQILRPGHRGTVDGQQLVLNRAVVEDVGPPPPAAPAAAGGWVQRVSDGIGGGRATRTDPARGVKQRTEQPAGYPRRAVVPAGRAGWATPLPGYQPPEYTAPTVLANDRTRKPGGWADPVQPPGRYSSHEGPVQVDLLTNRPLNPLGRTGIRGRGLLGKWGRNPAADPIITRVNPKTGLVEMAAIQRGAPVDGRRQWAIPGGMVDDGESVSAALGREFEEETGQKLTMRGSKLIYQGHVDDPRNTDNAWMETTVRHRHLTDRQAARVSFPGPADPGEITAVRWAPITRDLLDNLYASHGSFVGAAARDLLRIHGATLTPAARAGLRDALKGR